MGMFDTVWFNCPRCNGQLEAQSKAGPCELKDYPSGGVPPEIAADIKGDLVYCDTCSRSWSVGTTLPEAVYCYLFDGGLS